MFSTNGDFTNEASIRFKEALNVLGSIGISYDNIYFLGFGDQWTPKETEQKTIRHIYHCDKGNDVWTSAIGYTHTYGTADKDCYLQCDYTRENYLLSLSSVIQQVRPDVIYAVDYENHADHKALSLLFDEAMGQILATDPSYKPVIYKGFCYGTAWDAEKDLFSTQNLLSTLIPSKDIWEKSNYCYDWQQRVRIPMSAENLNRIFSKNTIYRSFHMYASQNAYHVTESVLNGDKVFWERRTDSCLYTATCSVDGVITNTLNDFKLADPGDFADRIGSEQGITIGTEFEVVPESSVMMDTIVLYDNYSPDDNILGGYIQFSDTTLVPFTALNKNGVPTYIRFPERQVDRFKIVIDQTEGSHAGLAEIEAFYHGGCKEQNVAYLMAVDSDENFVYDYWLTQGSEVTLSLYSYPNGNDLSFDQTEIFFHADDGCAYAIRDGKLIVKCPEGKTASFRVSYGENISTSFTVSNPYAADRYVMKALQTVDIHYTYCSDLLTIYLNGLIKRFS